MKKKFYYSDAIYNTNSANEIVPYLMTLFKPHTVIDVGCGLGTWLSTFKKFGVKEIFGVDSSEYNDKMLIDNSEFRCTDLTQEFSLDKKFDLAVCLEVAEHIPEDNSTALVRSLISLSDTIVFSAAIPGQGGQDHLNEQWLEYWKFKFKEHGYNSYDVIRPKFWDNKNVDWWYRQNVFVVSSRNLFDENLKDKVFSMVHPDFYNAFRKNVMNVNAPSVVYLKLLLKSVLRKFKSFKRK